MIPYHLSIWTLLCSLLLAIASGCTKDALAETEPSSCEGPDPTYEADIRPIIEATCAYSGCHLGGAPGVYDTYNNILPDLQDGSFRERVISLRSDPIEGMPPNYSPAGRPTDLTPEELLLMECWLEAGFPQ